MWQDIAIGIISILFNLALVPQIIHGFKKKKGTIIRSTSVLNIIGISAMVFIYSTLQLYFTAGVAVISGIVWIIFLAQSIIYKKC